jgi:hypothetical protein
MKSGRCLCGAVSFSAEEVKSEISACHCRMCQRISGGIFITIYRSSDWAERGFCNKCGTHLFYRILESNEYDMCIGTFDDLSDFILTSEIFIDRKPDAYALAGEHPRLTEAETLKKYPILGN